MSEGSSSSSYSGVPLKNTPARPSSTLVPTTDSIFAHWKSTVSGFLTAFLAAGTYFSIIPPSTLIQHGVSQNMIFWATVAGGLAKVYIGLISKDAK